MSDLDVLRELINRRALVLLEETHFGKKAVVLSEPDNQGGIQYSIKIKEIPDDAVVVKTDMFSSPRHIFRVEGENANVPTTLSSPIRRREISSSM